MKAKPNTLLTIAGTVFEVDIETQRLIEKGRPENSISFIDQMTDEGTHYELQYDPELKNSPGDHTKPEKVQELIIPSLVDLDPAGMAERYGYSVEQIKGKTDFEVIVNQEALLSRKEGILPKIDIAGEQFIVDLRLNELRHQHDAGISLRLSDFDLTGDGHEFVAFYHPATRLIVELDSQLTEFPGGVVKIQIPGELELDPVCFARQYQINEKDLLRRYPVQQEIQARVTPLSETGVPALIQRNREQLKQHTENAKKIRPRPRF